MCRRKPCFDGTNVSDLTACLSRTGLGPMAALARGLIALCVFVMANTAASAAHSGWHGLHLEGVDGQQHALGAFIGRGQWVVVNIWGPRCPPCVEEMPELGSFHDAYADGPAMVLGIAIDFPSFGYGQAEEVRAFMEAYLLDFPVLLSDHTIHARLTGGTPLQAVPTSLIYAPDGALAVQHIGTLTHATLEAYLRKADPDFPVASP